MANTNHLPGALVNIYGQLGTVRYVTADGWYGVQLEGESLVHEWQPCQVSAA